MRMNEGAQTINQKSRSGSGIFRQIGYDEGLGKRQSAWTQSLEEDPGMSEMTPVPAATVVVARDSVAADSIEILLLKRNSKLVFHGGHWVFPGGRVDQADFAGADGLEYRAALRAAVRETKEEAGLEIGEGQLIHTAHWTTPPHLPRRFCTWFFMCPVPRSSVVSVDNDEILEHRWITPKAALAASKAEEIVLPQPTKETLKSIAQIRSVEALLTWAEATPVHIFPEDSPFYRPREMGYPSPNPC
jgi:8-oxo-dGTP pyrophosphatase MutT (NUDIX family)